MFWIISIWMIFISTQKGLEGDFIPAIVCLCFISFYFYLWKSEKKRCIMEYGGKHDS